MIRNHKFIINKLLEKKRSVSCNQEKIEYNDCFNFYYDKGFKAIIEKYTKLYIQHEMYDEIIQAANLGLIKAIEAIDKMDSNNFYVFASGFIKNEIKYILNCYENDLSYKQLLKFNSAFLLEDEQKDQLEEYCMAEDKFLFSKILGKLPAKRKRILELYFKEVPIYKIAKHMNMTFQQVKQEINVVEEFFGNISYQSISTNTQVNWSHLSELQVKIINLFFKENKTIKQISNILNIKTAAVMKEYVEAVAIISGVI